MYHSSINPRKVVVMRYTLQFLRCLYFSSWMHNTQKVEIIENNVLLILYKFQINGSLAQISLRPSHLWRRWHPTRRWTPWAQRLQWQETCQEAWTGSLRSYPTPAAWCKRHPPDKWQTAWQQQARSEESREAASSMHRGSPRCCGRPGRRTRTRGISWRRCTTCSARPSSPSSSRLRYPSSCRKGITSVGYKGELVCCNLHRRTISKLLVGYVEMPIEKLVM